MAGRKGTDRMVSLFSLSLFILQYKIFPEIYKITCEEGDIFKELSQDFYHSLPRKHTRHFSSKSFEEMLSTVGRKGGERNVSNISACLK